MLSDLKKGDKAVILSLLNINQLVRRRLLDLGVSEGSRITIKSIMPFGGPKMIECNGQSIAIRRKDASLIAIEREWS